MGILDDRTALVTGAASGIGYAIAQRIAEDGGHVYALDRNEQGLKQLVDESDNIAMLIHDLDTEIDFIDTLPSRVDVLVNCAGYPVPLAPPEETEPAEFQRAFRVMVEAPFRLTRLVLPHMYENGWGRIVNIGSVYSLLGREDKLPYVVAKHAIEGMSKVVALNGANKGVTCNTVCAAHANTAFLPKQISDESRYYGWPENEYLDGVLLRDPAISRLVEPTEIAGVVAVLYGPDSTMITGAAWTIDGGWTIR